MSDVNDKEDEATIDEGMDEPMGIILFRSLMGTSSRGEMEAQTYDGSSNDEELVDYIGAMDKHFQYEEVVEEKRVKFVVTRLRGHATLRWDGVQAERNNKGKTKISNWNRMVEKLKSKFLPKYQQLSLFRQMKILKQRL